MFKKIIPLIGITSALLIAGQANAAVVPIAGSAQVTPTNCAALSNNITAQMSNGVQGAYNCDATSFVAGACATKGTLKLQSTPCQYDAGTSLLKTGYTGCPADNAAAVAAQLADANNAWPKTTPIESRLGYAGGSAGGQVAASPMGIVCDAESLALILPDSDLVSEVSTSAP